eukprot:jgi/Galph1/1343/GphlegSOOS_G5988.1
MPRNRFSLLDLQAETRYLRKRCLGARVVNIYDITPTTYLLKISVPPRNNVSSDSTEEPVTWEKTFILIESGIRIHETKFAREKSNVPSGFSVKLRKHIRSRKIQQLRTIGTDRVFEFVFSARATENGVEKPCRLIVECYSTGNIILTDDEYTILSALRSYRGTFGVNKEIVHIFTRNKYPVHLLRSNMSLSTEYVFQVLKEAPLEESVRKYLSSKLACGPQIIEHALVAAGYPVSKKVGDIVSKKDTFFIKELDTTELKDDSETSRTRKDIVFEDFAPILFCQMLSKKYMILDTFNEAVDSYFARLEEEKAKVIASKQETTVSKKVQALKKDMERRIAELEKTEADSFQIAQTIELNAEDVDKAILVVRAMIANGVDWKELENMLEEEKEKGNPVAQVIHSLHLERNEITLMLSMDGTNEENWKDNLENVETENLSDDDEREEAFEVERMNAVMSSSKPVLLADVDLSLSAFANAARYFENRRRAQEKKEKAMEATKKALNVAEKKATKQVERSQQGSLKPAVALREIRKPFWFEKFDWFISSENYLVIAGRDAQQNELIVKRYMRPYDVYVHADIHGASSVVVKNNSKDMPIPLMTLTEAGSFAMCHSSAWSSKIVSSAWWVHAGQVSKTAPSGEYLTTGSFMIRGKKNYLPPSQLVMGYGILFKLDSSCIENHRHERQVRMERAEVQHTLEHNEKEKVPEESNDFPEKTQLTRNSTIEGNTEALSMDREEDSVKDREMEELFDKYQEKLSDHLEQLNVSLENNNKDAEATQLSIISDVPLQRDSKEQSKQLKQKEAIHTKPNNNKNAKKEEGQRKEHHMDTLENTDINKLPRGKRNKIKRAKKRYSEQTEEERRMAMALLGSSKLEKDAETTETNSNATLHQESFQPEKNEREDGFVKKRNIQVAEDEDNFGVADETNIINLFTGQPIDSDILEFAIHVCAPYQTLSHYKYRIKLIPGTSKKGKAAKTAKSILIRMAENNKNLRERDLIRAIPDQECIQTMISDVRLMAPGLQEAIASKKK